ncbi:hypothetical protein CYMTET_53473 [Cymbomonas tetramitiformis]|uniref:Uncharacterized protein n=1 Tax=Cymbomonas tetramitiformis TaxID=36881 RepID=A0AAE0BGT6_9CHLO|nr:hypothetical protein CYMTET_53473 [Cymbomonas tetramitiformis]
MQEASTWNETSKDGLSFAERISKLRSAASDDSAFALSPKHVTPVELGNYTPCSQEELQSTGPHVEIYRTDPSTVGRQGTACENAEGGSGPQEASVMMKSSESGIPEGFPSLAPETAPSADVDTFKSSELMRSSQDVGMESESVVYKDLLAEYEQLKDDIYRSHLAKARRQRTAYELAIGRNSTLTASPASSSRSGGTEGVPALAPKTAPSADADRGRPSELTTAAQDTGTEAADSVMHRDLLADDEEVKDEGGHLFHANGTGQGAACELPMGGRGIQEGLEEGNLPNGGSDDGRVPARVTQLDSYAREAQSRELQCEGFEPPTEGNPNQSLFLEQTAIATTDISARNQDVTLDQKPSSSGEISGSSQDATLEQTAISIGEISGSSQDATLEQTAISSGEISGSSQDVALDQAATNIADYPGSREELALEKMRQSQAPDASECSLVVSPLIRQQSRGSVEIASGWEVPQGEAPAAVEVLVIGAGSEHETNRNQASTHQRSEESDFLIDVLCTINSSTHSGEAVGQAEVTATPCVHAVGVHVADATAACSEGRKADGRAPGLRDPNSGDTGEVEAWSATFMGMLEPGAEGAESPEWQKQEWRSMEGAAESCEAESWAEPVAWRMNSAAAAAAAGTVEASGEVEEWSEEWLWLASAVASSDTFRMRTVEEAVASSDTFRMRSVEDIQKEEVASKFWDPAPVDDEPVADWSQTCRWMMNAVARSDDFSAFDNWDDLFPQASTVGSPQKAPKWRRRAMRDQVRFLVTAVTLFGMLVIQGALAAATVAPMFWDQSSSTEEGSPTGGAANSSSVTYGEPESIPEPGSEVGPPPPPSTSGRRLFADTETTFSPEACDAEPDSCVAWDSGCVKGGIDLSSLGVCATIPLTFVCNPGYIADVSAFEEALLALQLALGQLLQCGFALIWYASRFQGYPHHTEDAIEATQQQQQQQQQQQRQQGESSGAPATATVEWQSASKSQGLALCIVFVAVSMAGHELRHTHLIQSHHWIYCAVEVVLVQTLPHFLQASTDRVFHREGVQISAGSRKFQLTWTKLLSVIGWFFPPSMCAFVMYAGDDDKDCTHFVELAQDMVLLSVALPVVEVLALWVKRLNKTRRTNESRAQGEAAASSDSGEKSADAASHLQQESLCKAHVDWTNPMSQLGPEAKPGKQDQEEPAVTSPAAGFYKLSPTSSPGRHKEPGKGDTEQSGGGVTDKEPGEGDIEQSSGEDGEHSDCGSDSDRMFSLC